MRCTKIVIECRERHELINEPKGGEFTYYPIHLPTIYMPEP